MSMLGIGMLHLSLASSLSESFSRGPCWHQKARKRDSVHPETQTYLKYYRKFYCLLLFQCIVLKFELNKLISFSNSLKKLAGYAESSTPRWACSRPWPETRSSKNFSRCPEFSTPQPRWLNWRMRIWFALPDPPPGGKGWPPTTAALTYQCHTRRFFVCMEILTYSRKFRQGRKAKKGWCHATVPSRSARAGWELPVWSSNGSNRCRRFWATGRAGRLFLRLIYLRRHTGGPAVRIDWVHDEYVLRCGEWERKMILTVG